jgi:uncharacterized SAM-binding protein YcdF (DUF218 family)
VGYILKKTRSLKIVFFAGCVFVAATLCGYYVFRHLGVWLAVSDPLPPSLDAVFTFAGEGNRIQYSRKLYDRYPGALWILSYPGKKILVPLAREGCDTRRIAVVDTCKNTFSEVGYIKSWADSAAAAGAFSRTRRLNIGLVSNPYHMRRIRLMALRGKTNLDVAFYFLPVPFEEYGFTKHDYEYWWRDEIWRGVVAMEVQKIIYYSWR